MAEGGSEQARAMGMGSFRAARRGRWGWDTVPKFDRRSSTQLPQADLVIARVPGQLVGAQVIEARPREVAFNHAY